MIDPTLLRPDRLDMHIHMLYRTASCFRFLASNYFVLLKETEDLILIIKEPPAEVAEHLLQDDDSNVSRQGLIEFVTRRSKKMSLMTKTDQSLKIYITIIILSSYFS